MDAEIQIELVKLVDGTRLLRLSEPTARVCLEKAVDPAAPIARQKERWLRVFRDLLAREAMAAA